MGIQPARLCGLIRFAHKLSFKRMISTLLFCLFIRSIRLILINNLKKYPDFFMLKKNLTLLDVFSITIGAVVSVGVFLLPGLAYAKAGPGVLVSYFLAGLLASIGMLNQAELVSAMPKAGDTYFYVSRTMGLALGTVYGLITLTALSLKSAFELTAKNTEALRDLILLGKRRRFV